MLEGNTKMIRAVLFMSLFLLSSFCNAVTINGTWKADKQLSMSFNRTYAKLTERQEKLLSELMGNLTVTYKDGIATVMVPDIQVTVKSGKRVLKGFTSTSKYTVIGETNDTMVFEDIDNDGKKHYSIIKFVNPNQYWLYVPNIGEGLEKFHVREYFVRQK